MIEITYLKGVFPTPREERLTYEETVELFYDAGWNREPVGELTTAVALCRAESAGDPKAYLAYIEIRLNNMLDNNPTIRFAAIKAWVSKLDSTLELHELRFELEDFSSLNGDVELGVTAADRGLMQISSKYHPGVLDRQAFEPSLNAEYAYQLYVGWKRSFKPWAAYHNKSYERFLPFATEAVRKLYPKLVPPLIPPQEPPPTPTRPVAAKPPYFRLWRKKWYHEDEARFRVALLRRGIRFYDWVRNYPGHALRVFNIRKESKWKL